MDRGVSMPSAGVSSAVCIEDRARSGKDDFNGL